MKTQNFRYCLMELIFVLYFINYIHIDTYMLYNAVLERLSRVGSINQL